MEFIVRYGVELEEDRVKKALEQLEWYKEHGYNPMFPASCDPENDSIEEILDSLRKEYVHRDYERAKNNLLEALEPTKDSFLETLRDVFGKEVPDTYTIRLTKYGVGGSYGLPSGMVINFVSQELAADTVYHEIIHLMIESDTQHHEIQHWEKERIVDLILHSEKFSFLNYKKWQKNNYNGVGEYIDPLFKKYFFTDCERFFTEIASNRL